MEKNIWMGDVVLFKKIILAVFSAVIVLYLIGCSSGSDTESFDAAISGALDEVDMNGYVFSIACTLYGNHNALNPGADYEIRSDKLITRYNQIKADHNCDFNIRNGVDMTSFKTLYYAGDMYADVILCKSCIAFYDGYVQSGLFMPWTAIDAIDITDYRYGSDAAKDANIWKDDYYGIDAQYLQMPCADTMPAMFFNPTTIRMFGQPKPFDLYETGNWDWAHFETMCHSVYDVSSSDENEWVLAMGYTSEPYLELACIYSNGGSFIEKEKSGRLVFSLDSDNAKNAMEFIVKLRADGYIMDDGDRQNITPFCANRRAFFFEFSHLGMYTESSSNLALRMEDEFDWITFPKGPDAEGEVISTKYSWHSRHFYLPSNVNYDYIGAVIPELFDFLPGEDKDTWEKDFYSVNFFNQESFEFYKKIRDHADFDYSVFCNFTGSVYNCLLNITRGTRSLTEAISSVSDNIQDDLDRRYNSVFGY